LTEGKVTKIERQKKDKKRYSLFVDDKFVLGISQETLANLGLKAGDKIDNDRLNDIERKENISQAKEFALKLLSFRPRSKKELKDRLKKKAFVGEVIEQTLDRLEELNLIDDQKFASMWVEEKLKYRPTGRRVLERELYLKGIEKDIIQEVLDEVYSGLDEKELALKILEKKKKQYAKLDEDVAKRRINNLLLRRGFSYQTIASIFYRWKEMVGE
jgi:regulatory protein